MTVIVVGGGVAGLVAARELVLGGEQVLLLEASDRLGGIVAHQTVGDILIDTGAESFATRRGSVAALATSLGLADAIVEPNPEGAWLRKSTGESLPLPATSMLGIPGVPLAADVVAVIGRKAAWRAMLDALMPGTVGARSQTLGTLVAKRMGEGVLRELVAPVVEGIHSRHPNELVIDRAAPTLRQALLREGSLARAVRDLRSPAKAGTAIQGIRGGMNRIVEELVADIERFGVEVRLNTRVESVAAGTVVVDGETLVGDVVVAAPHVPGAAVGIPDADEQVTVVVLVVDNPALDSFPRGTGVLVATGSDGVTARALTHSTAKWPWLAERVPAGRHVVRLSYDTTTAPDDLESVARADAEALLGVPLGDVVALTRADWRRPAPQGEAVEGVWLTGEATGGTGLANVVAHATATAQSLLATRADDEVPNAERR